MGKLTTEARKRLSAKDFGEPGKRAYPMPDKGHARDAKARASEAVNKGRMSKSTEAKIDAKADRKLGKGGKLNGAAMSIAAKDPVPAKRTRRPKDDTPNHGSQVAGRRGHMTYS